MPMPGLRSLKGIGRRKSATPALDDSNSSPTTASSGSSFRVIPREQIGRKPIGSSIEKPLPAVLDNRRTWSEEDSNSSNRGSGSSATTANSRFFDRPSVPSTSPSQSPIDRPRSSNRLSALSANPVDASSRNRYSQRPAYRPQSNTFLDLPSDLDQEDFGSMFNGMGDTKSQAMAENSLAVPRPMMRVDSEPTLSADTPWQYRQAKTPPPMAFRRHADLEPSPQSVNSKTSRDGLLSSPASGYSPYRDETPAPPLHRSPLTKLADSVDELRMTDNGKLSSTSSSPLRRSESIESFSRSGADEDADAKMVRNSVIAMRRGNGLSPERTGSPVSRGHKSSGSNSLHPPFDSSTSSETSFKTQSLSSDGSTSNGYSTVGPEKKREEETVKSDMSTSASTTPRQGLVRLTSDDDDDDEPLANLPSAPSYMKRASFAPPSPSRATDGAAPAAFRGLQESQESKRITITDKLGILNSSQTSSVDSIEEKERRESPTKQSRREAEEILFRQKLAKDIGDHTSSLTPRPLPKHASQSAPNLLSINSLPRVSEDGNRSSSDDDDDIPLAVLQAHNFPNRTKTPDSRFSQNSYIGTSGRPPSTFGAGSVMNNRTSLPPFARKLPEDPYGNTQNMMNGSASRESLLLNRTSMFPPGQSPVPGLPPGGLVGVIAEEEKMKSIRRAGTDMGKSPLPPMGLAPGMSMGMSGLNIPGLGPAMGPMMPMAAMQDQSQINQQLLQVVQQQTVMLQAMYTQMQSQMGMNMSPVLDQNGFLQPPQPQAPGSPRPMSIMSGVSRPGNPRTRSMVNLSRPQMAPRTMSMINTSSPFAQNWPGPPEPLINSAGSVRGLGFDGGYAPSVAPSERSNIGQPSRYRPVTNSHLGDTGSMITFLAPEPPAHEMDSARKKKSGFFSAIMHPKGKASDVGGGEEDEDWSSFAKKRRSAVPSSFR